jgi:hypothetical protein
VRKNVRLAVFAVARDGGQKDVKDVKGGAQAVNKKASLSDAGRPCDY